EQAGHTVLLVDGHLENLSISVISDRIAAFQPDFVVVTTAPSYLFWRCAPPELRVPKLLVQALRPLGGTFVAIGPHASTTPQATLSKLAVDAVILGEPEAVLPQLADRGDWRSLTSVGYWQNDEVVVQGGSYVTDMSTLPALQWPSELIQRHTHHHHRFDTHPTTPAAEMETSRGCPYHCSFCAKENFRNGYRRRPLPVLLEELDGLIAQGVEYIYFIDEIFLPHQALLQALVDRPIQFGIQTRIDLWNRDMLTLLGKAGCVSIEAGVESISTAGRQLLDKNCKLTTDELSDRLIYAKQHVPFVQANLLDSQLDDPEAIAAWRDHLQHHGVWANKPVPLFAYPGSPDYVKRWGFPDDQAWERAHADYLTAYSNFSDIQEENPLPLAQLERL
ncbi:MAG TPA: TIGR04295 family B12-binding domain-containing radical SAM protein, partial [Coleofasciculaceae cyanobacterium]